MFKRISLFMLVLLLCSWQAKAADIYDENVKVLETKSSIIYYGSTYYAAARGTGDSLTNHFTQFFEIIDCNDNPAYLYAYCTDVAGTEDVNVLAYYSMDCDSHIVSSLNSGVILDQLTTTPAGDTINVFGAAYDEMFGGSRWMRLCFDGQTGNTNCYVYWWAVFTKDNMEVSYRHSKNIRDHEAEIGILALLMAAGYSFYLLRRRKKR